MLECFSTTKGKSAIVPQELLDVGQVANQLVKTIVNVGLETVRQMAEKSRIDDMNNFKIYNGMKDDFIKEVNLLRINKTVSS